MYIAGQTLKTIPQSTPATYWDPSRPQQTITHQMNGDGEEEGPRVVTMYQLQMSCLLGQALDMRKGTTVNLYELARELRKSLKRFKSRIRCQRVRVA